MTSYTQTYKVTYSDGRPCDIVRSKDTALYLRDNRSGRIVPQTRVRYDDGRYEYLPGKYASDVKRAHERGLMNV